MSESNNNVPCLTSQDCNTRSQELGKVFYEGEYSTKGCFSKGDNNVFFSLGNEDQMSTPTISGGSRERVWCTTADAAAGDDLTMSMPAEEPLGSVSSELLPKEIELSFTEPKSTSTLEEGNGQTAVLAWQANTPPSSSTTNVTEDTTGDESGKPSLKEGTANDPCNSNDGEQWDLLAQAMFVDGINPDTGEQIQVNDENFLLNYKLPKPCLPNVTATAEDGEDEEDNEAGDETDGEGIDNTPEVETGVEANEDSPPDESPTELKSFYSCSDTASPSTPPSDATEVTINYDYELYVPSSASLGEEILSKFENTVTNDLAGKYGLISCNAKNEGDVRRYLRGLMQDKDVLALASDPVDESLDTECAVQVSSATCTPIRGYMTMWLPPDSSSTAKEVESEILSYIENGMTNDMYVSDDIIKVAYVGPRDYEEDETIGPDSTTADSLTQDGGTADNNEQGGGSVESGNSDSTEAADDNDTPDNTTDGSDVEETNDNDPKSSDLPFTDKNNGSNSDGLVVDASTGSTSSQELASNDDGPLLAIGLSLLFVALAMAVVAALYVRRKKRNRRYFSDGPSDMNNNKSNAARNALTVNTDQPADTADVQLLPSPDKLDMRSVFSSEDGYITEPETENHTFANRDSIGNANKYGNLYGGSYGNGVTPMKGASVEDQVASNVVRSESEASDTPKNSVQTRVSGLAAMGAASTLVTSYSGIDSMSMQGYSKEEEYSENESQISASDHSSHVGIVDAFTPNGASDADEEGSLSSKEASTFQSDNAWA